jgi:hypothetical protein
LRVELSLKRKVGRWLLTDWRQSVVGKPAELGHFEPTFDRFLGAGP